MSARSSEPSTRHPRETTILAGHHEAEQTLLNAYRSGRIPHAWLIGGARGIGKATLAYRMARFVLAHPDPTRSEVQSATTLAVPSDSATARHVASDTHGGLLALERAVNERGTMGTVITVDQAREASAFFAATAAVGGWRVCIVDTVDELNANAANALLKILEEPPARSLFLLVTHAPSRVLATIQSRCRKLPLRPLPDADVARAAADVLELSSDDPDLARAAAAADGSAGRALMLLSGEALGLYQRTSSLLDALPRVDHRALHELGDSMGLADRAALGAFADTVERWMARRLHADGAAADLPRLARLAEVWEKIAKSVRETEMFNLERKPLVFAVFGLLAEATR